MTTSAARAGIATSPGRELTYVFVSVDQLLDDFERGVQNWSSQ